MAKVPDETHPTLVVEYALDGWGDDSDVEKRHALEDALDQVLRQAGLGLCDGGEIGSGSMQVFCPVFDYAKSKAAVGPVLAQPQFAGYKRMYRIPGEKPAKGKSRGPGFKPGDCLAVTLPSGRYSAAYIAAVDEKEGSNVVVDLDYLERRPPTLDDFACMKPLRLTHHSWNNVLSILVVPERTKDVDAIAQVVGNRSLKLDGIDVGRADGTWINRQAKSADEDPTAGRYLAYSDWQLGDQVVRQRDWDKGGR
jgi:hypothetical protein